MGLYVNPIGQTKESWLQANADRLLGSGEALTKYDEIRENGHVVLCLVDNGPFKALAVAYNQGELEEFSRQDERPRSFWVVGVDKLNESAGIGQDDLVSFGLAA